MGWVCGLVLRWLVHVLFLYQVVVGSFLPSSQQDLKPKKPKSTEYAAITYTPAIAVSSAPPPQNNAEKEDVMGGGHVLQNSGTINSSLNTTTPPNNAFRRDNWVNMHSMQDSRKSATDINISLPDS